MDEVEAVLRERIAREIETFAAARLRGGGSRVVLQQGRHGGESNAFAIAVRLARGEHPAGGPLCRSRFTWMGAVVPCERPHPPHDGHGNQAIRWRDDDPRVTNG